MARSLSHEPKTAEMAPHSWSKGSSGNSRPVRSRVAALNSATSSLRSSAVRSVSKATPLAFFLRSSSSSKGSGSSSFSGLQPSTTSEYMLTKRR